ncbi:MAG: LamG domain-containing protein, partial [Planctomycetota bacterium]|nr:LamG domain-containing protein [Planctomycetota bacterium]
RDGALIWRFRAAPRDQRLLAFEQLESVWPVHGSTLVWDGVVHAVAGRSNFLDGGLRYVRLDAKSGRKLSETIIDERDPETGETLQVKVQILNMPAGLPDILSSDGEHVYMRSQKFDRQGNRLQIGPHSGEPAKQGAVQRGEGLHLFAPMGFVDDTWFHRSYWVYGRSFAGGHSGYYQAGRFTAAGRILVFDESNVYGFGRKAAYYRWTTTIEHQLFSTSKTPPEVPESWLERRGRSPMIRFEKAPTLDPTNQPLAVEAWAKAERPNGVVVAHGGPARGYALVFQRGRPQFVVRVKGTVFSVRAPEPSGDRWVHLAGVLEKDGTMRLHVDGKLAGTTKASGLITQNPAQSLEIGGDDGGSVGDYRAPFAFTGLIDEVRVYHGTVTARDVEAHHARPADTSAPGAELVLACSFDGGDAKDESGKKNDGKVEGIRSDRGTRGLAMRFNGGRPRGGGSLVRHHWTKDLPFFVRAMVLADETLFLAGPPDVVDEEETFRRLTARDPAVATQLARQAAALEGENGGHLWAVSSTDGKQLAEVPLKSLPVWDGMAAARGRLYLATQDGKVVCFGE